MSASARAQSVRFECGKPTGRAGALPLSASSLYADNRPGAAASGKGGISAGWDLQPPPASFSGGACSSDKPFFFSLPAVDGDYRVTVVLGGNAPSTTTVKAESRRLMVLERVVAAGKSATETFIVNVRTPTIAGKSAGGAALTVKLKQREIGALDWDDKLTLEFNGEHPAVRSISIARVTDVPTVYLSGDSTVVDQDKEPWAAWGQMLPMFFGPGVSIANNAESGETIRSFVGERRLDKILSVIKPGDYLLVQFAHNDQKAGSGFVPINDYTDYLKRYINEARTRHATPILVTSMNRRVFDGSGKIVQTLGDYPEATREVGASEHVAVIDLNAMSKILFEAMGPDGTLKAFVHYPANSFPDQTKELKDDTHFNAYGGYELARCIVDAIRRQKLPLAPLLRHDIKPFDPAHPDPVADWHLPASPFVSTDTPYGR